METRLFVDRPALFDQYVAAHPRGDVLQTTAWGRVKETTGWQAHPLGVLSRGVLRAAALILTKRLPYLPAQIAYSPGAPSTLRRKPWRRCCGMARVFSRPGGPWSGRWIRRFQKGIQPGWRR